MKTLIGRSLLACLLLFSASLRAETPIPADIQRALASESRTEADRQRDVSGKTAELLTLLALKPGDIVADVFAGSGYFAQVLAELVGPQGKVYLHNNSAWRKFVSEDLNQRLDRINLPQLVIHDREVTDLDLGVNKLDAIIIIMGYHDLYFVDEASGWSAIDSAHFLGQLFKALKPGGKLLVVDHAAVAGTGSSAAQTLHRIDEIFAREDIARAGFVLTTSSELLRNRADTRQLSVFDDQIRGRTDRFVYLFKKP